MSSDKKKWVLLGVGTVLIAAGLGALIYLQHKNIEKNRVEVERLKGEIDAGRALVATTPDLEHNVILQRETDAVIKEILSDEEEATNLMRTINAFEVESGIVVKSVKLLKDNANARNKTKEDFTRVGYTVTFDADAFQFLAFLDALESHKRFINVRSFKLTAAKRAQIDRGGAPVHNISLDLETYVYVPKQGITEAKIDNYDRKRDLLLAEIQKRSDELRVPVYEYKGAGSRRDPWVDPRMLANDPNAMSIPDQIKIADGIKERVEQLEVLWVDVEAAPNIIALMKARTALLDTLVPLEEELKRLEGVRLGYKPVEIRLDQYRDDVARIREQLEIKTPDGKMTSKELTEAIESVRRQVVAEDYEAALSHFKSIEPQLLGLEKDPERAVLAEELRRLANNAQTVLDFEKIEMTVGGVAIMEGARPVALINGDTIIAGEYVDMSGELFINDIRPHEIEFVYKGVTLIRPVDERTPTTVAKAGKGKRDQRK